MFKCENYLNSKNIITKFKKYTIKYPQKIEPLN